jgi:hypothetical protein
LYPALHSTREDDGGGGDDDDDDDDDDNIMKIFELSWLKIIKSNSLLYTTEQK